MATKRRTALLYLQRMISQKLLHRFAILKSCYSADRGCGICSGEISIVQALLDGPAPQISVEKAGIKAIASAYGIDGPHPDGRCRVTTLTSTRNRAIDAALHNHQRNIVQNPSNRVVQVCCMSKLACLVLVGEQNIGVTQNFRDRRVPTLIR